MPTEKNAIFIILLVSPGRGALGTQSRSYLSKKRSIMPSVLVLCYNFSNAMHEEFIFYCKLKANVNCFTPVTNGAEILHANVCSMSSTIQIPMF